MLKNATKDVTKLKKRAVLANSGSHKTSLSGFLALVLQISKGKKTNTISTKGRVSILKRAKANDDNLLIEFIKVGESEVLKQREKQHKEKNELMKDAIKSIGTEIVDQPEWNTEKSTIKQLTLPYAHPFVDEDDYF